VHVYHGEELLHDGLSSSRVLLITVTEFVGKPLYILQKHSSKSLKSEFNFNDYACLTSCIMCQKLIHMPFFIASCLKSGSFE
jgi:hypothetical protein